MPSPPSLWDRIRAVFRRPPTAGKVALEDDRIVLRELSRARGFPQEPASPGPKEMTSCERCGGRLRQVVFTTAGSGDQIAIWREYPLAIDGWVCPECGWSAMPRTIGVEESVEFGRMGAEHASLGQFDDAEFWFRRIVASWPGYPAGYADLGQLASARADRANDREEKRRYRGEAQAWLRRAVDGDPEVKIPQTRAALARALALDDKEGEALALLDGLLTNAALPDVARAEAETLAADLRSGKALFSRATELAGDCVLEPPGKALAAADRRALEQAAALLAQANERRADFATRWFAGKVQLRLGNMEAALASLQQAHALDPGHPDGCRELGSALLELDRATDALPVARRAVESRPADAGLRCNLALVLMLVGEVAEAHAEATRALALDPADAITKGLLAMIEEVNAGRKKRPRSLAEAEGRAR